MKLPEIDLLDTELPENDLGPAYLMRRLGNDFRIQRLDCTCRTPERPPRVDSIGIELQHLLVELLSGRRRRRKAIEIADVLPSLFDDPRIVVVFRSLV